MNLVWEKKELVAETDELPEGGQRPGRNGHPSKFLALNVSLPGGDNTDSLTNQEGSFEDSPSRPRLGSFSLDGGGRKLTSGSGRLHKLADVVQSVQRKGLKITSRMTISERWRGNAARIVYSPRFRYYYAFMISINVLALVYSFHDPEGAPHVPWFIALEAFITAALLAEVMLRIVAEGLSSFCRSCSNVFDAVVALMCLASLAMFVITPALTEYFEEDIAFLLRCIRDTVRLMRLVFLCKNTRQSHVTHTLAPVTLRMAALDENESEALMDDSIPASPAQLIDAGMLESSPAGMSLDLHSPPLMPTLSEIEIDDTEEEAVEPTAVISS